MNRPLTILNVAYPFAPVGGHAVGGAEQVLTELDDFLHARGHDSRVLACAGSSARGTLCTAPLPSGALDEATRERARVHYRATLDALLAREHVDVVHLHGVDFHRYLPPAHVPTLVSLHLPLSQYPAEALAVRRPNLLLCCVSAAQLAAAPDARSSIGCVPNGVRLELITPHAEHDDYLLVLGRICPEKGIHHALDTAHRLDLPAIVAGRVYPYAAHERYFAQEIAPRLDARRRFLGPVALPEKAELLARARCLMVPSLVDETSSLASMEALAAGTPVVALRRGALSHVVEHGVTGFVVEQPEQLADAVRAVGGLDRARCRAAAEARFSAIAMCERYLGLYRQLAGAPGPRTAPLQLEEVHTARELEQLEAPWRSLWQRCPSATVFQRPEWLLAYVRHLLGGELRVLALRRAGALIGLCPFFVWCRGGQRVLSLLGAGVSDYQDVLFDPAEQRSCLRALEQWLRAAEVDACEWSELLPGSALLCLAADGAREGALESQDACPGLELPAPHTPLAPYLSSKLRHNLGTARRRAAHEAFGFEPATPDNLSHLLGQLMALHRARREQVGDASTFAERTAAFHTHAAAQLLAAGLLRMYALTRADGTCGGIIYGWHERRALRLYQHGFDPALSAYSPGALLCAHAIEHAIDEGATLIDFMRGAERYKYRWGARDRFSLTRRSFVLRRAELGAGDYPACSA